MTADDRVRVTTRVDVAPEVAFEVFTDEIDAWWRRGPRYRFRPDRDGRLCFVRGADGDRRLLEVYDDDPGDPYLVGRVLVWKQPERIVFEWRGNAFRPGQVTEVDVRFERDGEHTRMTLEHRGWDALPPDHPARHGLEGPAFSGMMGLWWGEQLVALRARAAGRPGP
ncbi:MAG: SRPBCC domain-containing protein [Myxococcota bacterium]